VKLAGTFSKLKPFNVLVVGDFMLDKYTAGTVNRISPEAPVSILKVTNEEYLPGGAGNVALNLAYLGARVYSLGRIGDDETGEILKDKLKQENINVENIFIQGSYKTPLKNRLLAAGQQLLRVDVETTKPLPNNQLDCIFNSLESVLNKIEVIAVSDYNKGFLTNDFLAHLIDKAKEKKIPIIVDPKGDNYSKYKGVDIIKPNLKEAYEAVKATSDASLKDIASNLIELTGVDHLLITMSESGISLFDRSLNQKNFPVQVKEVKDVTGAGDTVLSILCAAIANKIDIDHAIQFANIAAGIAIEKLGCAKVSLSELAKRLLEQDMKNKIFDSAHLSVLSGILDNSEFAVLTVDTLKTITSHLFKTVRNLSKKYSKLIVYIQEDKPNNDAIDFLSSLHEVDYIILKTESMKDNIKETIKTKNHHTWNSLKNQLDTSSEIKIFDSVSK